jgi:hypothetical protein
MVILLVEKTPRLDAITCEFCGPPPGGSSNGKSVSAISGHRDIPCVLLLDDPANELFLSVGLGADRILTPASQNHTALSEPCQHCVKSPFSSILGFTTGMVLLVSDGVFSITIAIAVSAQLFCGLVQPVLSPVVPSQIFPRLDCSQALGIKRYTLD